MKGREMGWERRVEKTRGEGNKVRRGVGRRRNGENERRGEEIGVEREKVERRGRGEERKGGR